MRIETRMLIKIEPGEFLFASKLRVNAEGTGDEVRVGDKDEDDDDS